MSEQGGTEEGTQDSDELAGGAETVPEPARRRGAKLGRRVALALIVVLGCWAGGGFRAWSDSGLSAAQADQADVRLSLDDFSLGQINGCDQLGGTQVVLQIPLHNYSPGAVVIRSITVDPPGTAPGATQKVGLTIPAGDTIMVEALIPIQLCTAHEATQCSDTQAELDATAAVVPESGRVHEIRLPIAEWVPMKFLQLYEDAPFAGWGSSWNCP